MAKNAGATSVHVVSCDSCSAPIIWVTMQSGKRMPVDYREKATILVTLAGETVSGFTSHFATCPNAAQHRKTKEQ